jgi:hypothetical protein
MNWSFIILTVSWTDHQLYVIIKAALLLLVIVHENMECPAGDSSCNNHSVNYLSIFIVENQGGM